MWTRQFGTAVDDIITGIVVHSSGVYIAGETGGTFPGEPSGSGVDIFVAQLAPDTGNIVWVRQYGVRGSFSGLGGVDADSTGVYVAGYHSSGDVNVPGGRLRRYDFDGNVSGSARFPTPMDTFSFSGLSRCIPRACTCRDKFKRASLATLGVVTMARAANVVGMVRKYDVEGNEIWTRKIKGKTDGGQGNSSLEARGVRVRREECSSAQTYQDRSLGNSRSDPSRT